MSYFLLIGQNRIGPLEMAQVLEGYTRGEYPRSSFAWTEGMEDWQELHKVMDLGSVLPPPPSHTSNPPPAPGKTASFSWTDRPAPRWPWMSALASLVLLVVTLGRINSIEDRARPLLDEGQRMQSTEYTAATVLEALYRGAQGDPLGTYNEQYAKDSEIQDRLTQLKSDYGSTQTLKTFFILTTLALAGVAIWKHIQWKKQA